KDRINKGRQHRALDEEKHDADDYQHHKGGNNNNIAFLKEYIDDIEKKQMMAFYLGFISNVLYPPSYLSLEYILSLHNLLTEMPVNFTSITLRKTQRFSNSFGNFLYHKIKKELFCGFEIFKKGEFEILGATKPKALFDFLYLRKNIIPDEKAFEELRLNLENIDKKDMEELKKYIILEGSTKMKEIYNLLVKTWK
ncbi:MAG: hypothetical protein NC905_06180, partial [Candidatus Omnitrophica bacterium]|nr:hypothetical protein [Candidatus Omnitrophota bacterium]